ncbi:uncharacterized protein LOC110064889 [Orbicella faveolata]|uniref:uncharacterized protein LOC110064889 n=1 Tax=Orbicella faveolata TaxID=48498 RepID=UPI0009E52902|nr:uncharacterized protein LOC110064889 [Orbicella faveolata]
MTTYHNEDNIIGGFITHFGRREDFNPRPRRILTETETELISQKRFNELVEQQKKVDAEIDAQLSRREEDLRLEEEVIKCSCIFGCEMRDVIKSGMDLCLSFNCVMQISQCFQNDSETFLFLFFFSTELDVEDFDAFLERVKARSLGSSPFVSPTATVPNGNVPWEDALAQGMEATKIAGKSLDALHGFSSSVDLVSVSER